MRCLHPIIRTYKDLMGREIPYSCPCGHCIACLHNEQDSWAIRLRETSFKFRDFVYDTLTFNNNSLPLLDLSQEYMSNIRNGWEPSPELLSLIRRYSQYDADTGEFRVLVPSVSRDIIRNWIKRARELFVYDHGYRPKWKYFIVMEYGPATSRPHFHLLFWGCSKSDYIHYLKKPWRQSYGFTKTKFIEAGTDKDRDCITRYVSKYVSKGVFESPFVREGLLPKPFRSISNGIGVEYLERACFDIFKTDKVKYLQSYFVHRDEPDMCRKYLREMVDYGILEEVPKYTERQRQYLSTYYDRQGFPHACPRYYKQKLLNLHKPNIFSYALQTLLLEDSRLFFNKNLQRFASELGGFTIYPQKVKDKFAGFSPELYHLLDVRYFFAQKRKAEAEAERRYIKLKNHYGRAMNLAFVA